MAITIHRGKIDRAIAANCGEEMNRPPVAYSHFFVPFGASCIEFLVVGSKIDRAVQANSGRTLDRAARHKLPPFRPIRLKSVKVFVP